jgi:ADP-ribosylglycohydrolase
MKQIQGILLGHKSSGCGGLLRVVGTAAIFDPEIAKALKITEEQATKIQEIRTRGEGGRKW